MNYADNLPHPPESDESIWVTGLTGGVVDYEHQLRALLALTPLRTIQWINLARRHVQLASLNK